MKINDLMQIVSDSYPDGFTDQYWNYKLERPRKGSGDTLAQAIVLELHDSFDATATELEQLREATRRLDWMMEEIGGVRYELLKRRIICENNIKVTR